MIAAMTSAAPAIMIGFPKIDDSPKAMTVKASISLMSVHLF
jgi:hypothetical protein